MSKYMMEAETADYGLSDATKYYATLFKTKTNYRQRNMYNACQIMFRLIHISSSSGMSTPKDMILTTNYDGGHKVNLVDLNPEVKRITVGYNISQETGNVTVSAKGSVTGAKIKLQVLYCTALGMFEFCSCQPFTNNITVVSPTNLIEETKLHLVNGWKDNQYYPSKYVLKNGICCVHLHVSGGNTDKEMDIADNLPPPKFTFRIPYTDINGVGGALELLQNGNLRIMKAPSKEDTFCTFSYVIK